MNNTVFFSVMAVLIATTLFLGWYGYRNTKDNDSFLLGRQKTNPMIIALSYGAAFLSASAIVGFGGQAATYGMSLMWLVFLNLFMGLVVAFLVFGTAHPAMRLALPAAAVLHASYVAAMRLRRAGRAHFGYAAVS